MRAIKRQFWLLVFIASAISRLLFMAGKTYFSAKKGTEFLFKRVNTQPGVIIMTVLVACNVIANIIAKIPAMYTYFLTDRVAAAPEEESSLGLRGQVVNTTLKTAGAGYGLLQISVAYFSISLIVKTAAELLGTTLENLPLQEEIPLQVALIVAALLASDTYLGYDYPLIKKNAHMLAEIFDKDDYSANKMALFKTVIFSSLNLATYPAVGYFYTEPTIKAIPGAEKYLGDVGIKIVTGVTCLTTLLTVISWLPSVYKHFSPHVDGNLPADSPASSGTICQKRLLRSVAYPVGVVDKLGEALTLYMAVNSVLTDLTNVKSGWIIALDALAAMNGFTVHLFFSYLPGVRKVEVGIDRRYAAAISRRDSEDVERVALLQAVAPSGMLSYSNPIRAAMLTFAPGTTAMPVAMNINVDNTPLTFNSH